MPKFKGQTNKEDVFKLDSVISEAGWLVSQGYINGSVPLQVRTAFVSHGSTIKVMVKNNQGKTLETIKGKVYANLFRKVIRLAGDAAGGVAFEVELPGHGLSAAGPVLAVGGPIVLGPPEIKNEKGRVVTKISRGMKLDLSAPLQGVKDGEEGAIRVLEKKAADKFRPLAVLPAMVKGGRLSAAWRAEYPDDTKPLSCQEKKRKTGEQYQSPKIIAEASCGGVLAKGPETDFADFMDVEVLDDGDEPVLNQKIKFTFADGTTKETTTDENGIAYIPEAPPGEYTAEIL